MKIIAIFIVIMAPAGVYAQKTLNLNDASKNFNLRIKADSCEERSCSGKATFSFYRKKSDKAFQEINVENTSVSFNQPEKPDQMVTLHYSDQSVLKVGDFNFDGTEDVAIQDGNNGPYGGASFAVYISDRKKGRFVHNKSFSEVAEQSGMFKVNKTARTLETSYVVGCCTQIYERYGVAGGKPGKIYEQKKEPDGDDGRSKITTKTLVGRKWKTTVKYGK